jgi:hypothetical protein
MKRYATTALSVLAIGLSTPAMAAFDGSEPLICATLEVHACEVEGACWEEHVESVDAPQFLRVSVQEKKVSGIRPSGAKVDANIDLINHASKRMFLQGVAGDRSWSVVIDETSGHMSGTVSDDQDAYIIFGACTPR